MPTQENISQVKTWTGKLLRDKRARSHEPEERIINFPLDIFSVETRKQYRRKLCLYTWNGLCQVLIGAVNMAVLIYAVLSQDVHAALCCFGQNFLIVQGILTRNNYNGWSIAFKPKDSRLLHIILQLMGVITSFSGSVYIVIEHPNFVSLHGIAGSIAMIACLLTMLIGTCTIYTRNTCTDFHKSFGVFTFIMSTVGLISGLLKSAFTHWAGYTITGIVIGCVVVYSLFIIWFVLKNLL